MVPSQRKVVLTVFPLELVGDTLDEDFTDELDTFSEELETFSELDDAGSSLTQRTDL